MARRKDAEDDRASRIVLDQLNTKTVGAPPSSTGLTGDQLPETVFNDGDFDLVRNQVTLQLQNLELLNVLNTIGQITNMQSQSGPIPETLELEAKDFTSAGYQVFFTPPAGTVYQVLGVSVASSTGLSGTGVIEVDIFNPTTSARLIVADQSFTSSSDFPVTETTFTGGPLHVDSNHQVRVRAEGTFTSVNAVTLGVIRVR